MELLKKHIHRNQVTCRNQLQFTVDDDFNVPDAKPDMDGIVRASHMVRMVEERAVGSKYYVRGSLCCSILYISSEGGQPLQSMEAEFPFDEVIHMEQECGKENVRLQCVVEDLNVNMIHSRKCSVKALLCLHLMANELVDEESVTGVIGETVEARLETQTISNVMVEKKETYRYRDQVLLPNGKPEVDSIIYRELTLQNGEVRAGNDQFTMKGVFSMFVLYEGIEGGEAVPVCDTQELTFQISVPVSGMTEDMIPQIQWRLSDYSITPQADPDGEMRILEAEAAIEFSILAYAEESCELMRDLYATKKKIIPVFQESICENLLVKNTTKFRLNARARLAEGMPGMHTICYAGGEVKLDRVSIVDNGLQTEGVVETRIYYETGDDRKPVQALISQIPFSEMVEVRGMQETWKPPVVGYAYEVQPEIDQVAAVLLDSMEADVKVAVSLDTLVMEERTEQFMIDAACTEYEEAEIASLPDAYCYYVQQGDAWFDIAKAHHTTMELLQRYNTIGAAVPVPGSHLLIVTDKKRSGSY